VPEKLIVIQLFKKCQELDSSTTAAAQEMSWSPTVRQPFPKEDPIYSEAVL
jgi:hypothetical protein